MNPAAPREAWRRTLHVASGSLGLLWYLGVPHASITILLLALLGLATILELLRWRLARVRQALERVALGALRPAEGGAVTGATLLALGYVAAWLVFPAAAAAPAIIVTAGADPAAALVGSRAGERGRKTWAGSAAAGAVAVLLLLAQRIAVLRSIAGALVAALAERAGARGLDNVTVPLATAAMLALLR